MRIPKGRVLICFLVVLALCALTFPRWHVLVGPRVFCSIVEIDVNTARIRTTNYFLYIPIRQSETETQFSSELRRMKLSRLDSNWIESSVKVGLGDYYPRPHGGSLLSSVRNLEVVLANRTDILSSDSVLAEELAEAFREENHD
jgi:hypothetical protein